MKLFYASDVDVIRLRLRKMQLQLTWTDVWEITLLMKNLQRVFFSLSYCRD